MASNSDAKGVRVIIIGAGLAGIATAIALKTQLNFDNFTIYEKADAVGGVWQENTYPGCGSDVPGHWYSLSTAPNPAWASYYPAQPALRAYWHGLWARHALAAHTRFRAEVVAAEWEPARALYRVAVEERGEGAKGVERREVEAEVVVWAVGGFQAPHVPAGLRGVDAFRGEAWHSARWRHDVPLAGKRVGVIGNGCSAAQFVPKISEDPSTEVINFVRSPQWYVPRAQYDYPEWVKWVFAHVPLAMWAYRAFIMASLDFNYVVFREGSPAQNIARKRLTEYIERMAPKEYHDQLIPKYPPGCKRMIVDPSYLSSLARPNLNLEWTAIDEIVEEGIKLKTGEVVPLDVIIFGTGFELLPPRLEIKGTKGTLSEYFKAHGGAAAYLGLAAPTFPNLFMLLGPNSAGGHASVIFVEETQLQHALVLIKPIIEGKAKSFSVREDVTDRYNQWLQDRISRTVWNSCHSYYRADGQSGRNIAIFPGPVTLFWWLARRPRLADYHAVGAERFLRERRLQTLEWWVFVGVLAASLVVGIVPPQLARGAVWSVWAKVLEVLGGLV
ncbi:FAD/NAD(P)-binding domain-containing protein [Artomyces pyxidatus]|uniref:FAD/NAD(P)-binding domain-containing protein n=1 Tax=Artomyces pyxidatus TaxID=48021 RepID=A0ACB8T8S6_9AGAM|nr:FAD/NAD(P)-binding domain-containing protein [Artomyces pyxidatus]